MTQEHDAILSHPSQSLLLSRMQGGTDLKSPITTTKDQEKGREYAQDAHVSEVDADDRHEIGELHRQLKSRCVIQLDLLSVKAG